MLHRELRGLEWTLNVQYSTILRWVGSAVALTQACQLLYIITLFPKHPKISVSDNALCNWFNKYWVCLISINFIIVF